MERQTKSQIDEYHLMVEEVLGGMDLMLSSLDKRFSVLESKVESILENSADVNLLRDEIAVMKSDFSNGLDLAFRKMYDK